MLLYKISAYATIKLYNSRLNLYIIKRDQTVGTLHNM